MSGPESHDSPAQADADGYTRLQALSRRDGPVVTWLAEDADGRKVVLKELQHSRLQHWKQLELFEREVAQLRQLKHARIPALLAHRAEPGRMQLVQAWIPGESLEERLVRGWHPGLDEIADIARQLLEILIYLQAFSPPVLHRDLKPSNLIRDPQGGIHLIDFGAVALALGPAGASTVVGTFGYMPPEQFTGQAGLSSDLYALGMSLLHLLSGKNPGEMTGDSLQPDWERFLHLPPAWQSWFEELVQPDSGRRFANARQALRAMPAPEALSAGMAPRALPPPQLLERLSDFDSGDTTCLAHWDPSRGSLWLRHRNSSLDAVSLRLGLLLCGFMGLAIAYLSMATLSEGVAGIGLAWVPWSIFGLYVAGLGACGLNLAFKAAELGFRREVHLDRRFLELRFEAPFGFSSSVSVPADQIRKLDLQPIFGLRRLRVHCRGGRVRTVCLSSNRREAEHLLQIFQLLTGTPQTGLKPMQPLTPPAPLPPEPPEDSAPTDPGPEAIAAWEAESWERRLQEGN